MEGEYKIVNMTLIIMKVYCPSYKRPDAPLFSVARNLIIVLQHEDEIAEYKRINEPRGHHVVCIDIDGNQRILEARNWIIEQDDDWSMQIDDDVTEFHVWNKESQSYNQSDWDHFIEASEKIINEVDHNKTGMIRFGNISKGDFVTDYPENDALFEIITKNFLCFQCALINNRLLKRNNFEYEGDYIFDESLGKYKTYGDDYFIQYWCVDNKKDVILMNFFATRSINNKWKNSTLYNGNYTIFDIMCHTFHWLLQRFKHNLVLSNDITKRLIHLVGKSSALEMYASSHKKTDSKIFEITKKLIDFSEKPVSFELYVPSHKRPDSTLFEIASGLTIILQHEEDIEPYSKWKHKHNVLYVPELKGLLDARNWILDNGKEWALMLDDDLLEIRMSDKKTETKLVWSQFLAETKKILGQLDDHEIGLVGFYTTIDGKFNISYRNEFIIDKNISIYRAVILNIPVLKSKGFKYEGYPYDGCNGQRAYAEDTNLLGFCQEHYIDVVKIYSLRLLFGSDDNTVCWGNPKNKEKMVVLSNLWLLNKYKNCPKMLNVIRFRIWNTYTNLRFYSQEELFNELVNELSYEGLDIDKGEQIMKMKMLCGGLLVLLMGVMNFTSCDNGDDNIIKGGNSYNHKKVDEKFQGFWRFSGQVDKNWWCIEITETEYKEQTRGGWASWPAWSEGDTLSFYTTEGKYEYKFKLENGNLVLTNPYYYVTGYDSETTLIKKP